MTKCDLEQCHNIWVVLYEGCDANLVFTFDRLWIWLSEVPGAAVVLFAWNHYFQGSFNTTVTV